MVVSTQNIKNEISSKSTINNIAVNDKLKYALITNNEQDYNDAMASVNFKDLFNEISVTSNELEKIIKKPLYNAKKLNYSYIELIVLSNNVSYVKLLCEKIKQINVNCEDIVFNYRVYDKNLKLNIFQFALFCASNEILETIYSHLFCLVDKANKENSKADFIMGICDSFIRGGTQDESIITIHSKIDILYNNHGKFILDCLLNSIIKLITNKEAKNKHEFSITRALGLVSYKKNNNHIILNDLAKILENYEDANNQEKQQALEILFCDGLAGCKNIYLDYQLINIVIKINNEFLLTMLYAKIMFEYHENNSCVVNSLMKLEDKNFICKIKNNNTSASENYSLVHLASKEIVHGLIVKLINYSAKDISAVADFSNNLIALNSKLTPNNEAKKKEPLANLIHECIKLNDHLSIKKMLASNKIGIEDILFCGDKTFNPYMAALMQQDLIIFKLFDELLVRKGINPLAYRDKNFMNNLAAAIYFGNKEFFNFYSVKYKVGEKSINNQISHLDVLSLYLTGSLPINLSERSNKSINREEIEIKLNKILKALIDSGLKYKLDEKNNSAIVGNAKNNISYFRLNVLLKNILNTNSSSGLIDCSIDEYISLELKEFFRMYDIWREKKYDLENKLESTNNSHYKKILNEKIEKYSKYLNNLINLFSIVVPIFLEKIKSPSILSDIINSIKSFENNELLNVFHVYLLSYYPNTLFLEFVNCIKPLIFNNKLNFKNLFLSEELYSYLLSKMSTNAEVFGEIDHKKINLVLRDLYNNSLISVEPEKLLHSLMTMKPSCQSDDVENNAKVSAFADLCLEYMIENLSEEKVSLDLGAIIRFINKDFNYLEKNKTKLLEAIINNYLLVLKKGDAYREKIQSDISALVVEYLKVDEFIASSRVFNTFKPYLDEEIIEQLMRESLILAKKFKEDEQDKFLMFFESAFFAEGLLDSATTVSVEVLELIYFCFESKQYTYSYKLFSVLAGLLNEDSLEKIKHKALDELSRLPLDSTHEEFLVFVKLVFDYNDKKFETKAALNKTLIKLICETLKTDNDSLAISLFFTFSNYFDKAEFLNLVLCIVNLLKNRDENEVKNRYLEFLKYILQDKIKKISFLEKLDFSKKISESEIFNHGESFDIIKNIFSYSANEINSAINNEKIKTEILNGKLKIIAEFDIDSFLNFAHVLKLEKPVLFQVLNKLLNIKKNKIKTYEDYCLFVEKWSSSEIVVNEKSLFDEVFNFKDKVKQKFLLKVLEETSKVIGNNYIELYKFFNILSAVENSFIGNEKDIFWKAVLDNNYIYYIFNLWLKLESHDAKKREIEVFFDKVTSSENLKFPVKVNDIYIIKFINLIAGFEEDNFLTEVSAKLFFKFTQAKNYYCVIKYLIDQADFVTYKCGSAYPEFFLKKLAEVVGGCENKKYISINKNSDDYKSLISFFNNKSKNKSKMIGYSWFQIFFDKLNLVYQELYPNESSHDDRVSLKAESTLGNEGLEENKNSDLSDIDVSKKKKGKKKKAKPKKLSEVGNESEKEPVNINGEKTVSNDNGSEKIITDNIEADCGNHYLERSKKVHLDTQVKVE
ncbi:MAG: hypothetical protein Tsb005_16450 [Gammaproteobacteria bacterium]